MNVFVLVYLFFLRDINCLNILGLFPHPGASHFLFFKPLLQGLAEKGHNVTVVSYFPNKDPIKNYTHLDLVGLPTMREFMDLKNFENENRPNPFQSYFLIHNWGLESCDVAFKSNAIAKILKANDSYDAVLVEQFNNDGMLAIAHVLRAPIIALSSCAMLPWHFNRMGTPFITSSMPDILVGISDNMTYFERIQNWFFYNAVNLMYTYLTQPATNKIIRKYLNYPVPDIEEIVQNDIALFLINQHYSLSGAKPYTPNVIEVGGLHIAATKTLDTDIKTLLDSAKSGVIYINWGSMIRSETLPIAKREAIINAVSRLDQVVLWKWENETMPNRPKNVHIRKWMPQREILEHPNVKVFMSHGGLLGSSEAVYCGVPMVITPIFGDQFLNAAAMESRGIGKILPFNEITDENTYNALKNALSSESRRNARIVAEIFKNRLKDPLTTAIWWVEHVAKTKGVPLNRPISINQSWFIYYSFDIYSILIIVVLSIYYVLRNCFRKLSNLFDSNSIKKKIN